MDLTKINDLNDLQILLDLMGRYQLSELELEGDGRKIRLKKSEPHPVLPALPFAGAPVALPGASGPGGMAQAPSALGGAAGLPPLPSNLHEVKSPMVGTFYRAPSPEADPFVSEGDRVEEKTVLCLIEAMKVMNEITAGISGVVKEILVKNGESVEFGKPLFRILLE